MAVDRPRDEATQPPPGESLSRGATALATLGLLFSTACIATLPQRASVSPRPLAPVLHLELAPSLESERSSCEKDVLAAISRVEGFFSSFGFTMPPQHVIDSVLVFETPLRAREHLSKEFGVPLEGIPETFSGTVAENRLFLVSRESYRRIWQQLYPEWPWTEQTYPQLIAHEIAHRMHELIVRELFGSSDAMGPVWFFEGLAVTCAGQFETQQAPLSREQLQELVAAAHSPAVSYPLYGRIVRSLAAESGVRVLVTKAAEPGFPEVLWVP